MILVMQQGFSIQGGNLTPEQLALASVDLTGLKKIELENYPYGSDWKSFMFLLPDSTVHLKAFQYTAGMNRFIRGFQNPHTVIKLISVAIAANIPYLEVTVANVEEQLKYAQQELNKLLYVVDQEPFDG